MSQLNCQRFHLEELTIIYLPHKSLSTQWQQNQFIKLHMKSKFLDEKFDESGSEVRPTMAIASSTSSLFLPATRPFNDSSASLSFFNRTCFSNEAASLSLACNQKLNSL
jgi:hypothetical protein